LATDPLSPASLGRIVERVDKTVQIDYKEVNRLRRYLSELAKIEARRRTGTPQHVRP
jgi:ribosomal protein S18